MTDQSENMVLQFRQRGKSRLVLQQHLYRLYEAMDEDGKKRVHGLCDGARGPVVP